jgi:hypothetical protein
VVAAAFDEVSVPGAATMDWVSCRFCSGARGGIAAMNGREAVIVRIVYIGSVIDQLALI